VNVRPRSWHGSSPVPRPKPGVAHVEIDGERVLYNPVTRAVRRLDPVGSVLWRGLDGEGTLVDLADDVAHAFRIEREAALEDCLAFVERLDQSGFLTEEAATPSP
jgi:hypothetical protein